MRYMDPFRHDVYIIVAVSSSRKTNQDVVSLDWIEPYFANVTSKKSYIVINMCGEKGSKQSIERVPKGTKIINIPAKRHSIDLVYAEIILGIIQGNDQKLHIREEDIMVFLDHDHVNLLNHSFDAVDLIPAADVNGFACMHQPRCSSHCMARVQPTVMHQPHMWGLFTVPGIHPKHNVTLGEWYVQTLGLEIPKTLVPVCYGRSFAIKRKQLSSRHNPSFWQHLIAILEDDNNNNDDNVRNAYYTERSWAAILSQSVPPDIANALLHRTRLILYPPFDGLDITVQDWEIEMQGMLLWPPL